MKKKGIISVIEFESTATKDCHSFIVQKEKDFEIIMKKAEKLFIKLANKNGMIKSEKEFCVQEGNYDNGNYYVSIVYAKDKS